MNSTIKRAVERAIEPAVEELEQKVASGYYTAEFGDAESLDDLPKAARQRMVAQRAVTIAQLRAGRTYDDATRGDAIDYAKTLVN